MKNLRKWLPTDVNQGITLLTLVSGIVLMILVRSGIVREEHFSTVIFSLISVFALNIYTLHKFFQTEIAELKTRLPGIDFKTFESSTDQLLYFTNAIKSAKKCVDDLSWTNQGHPQKDLPSRQRALAEYNRAVFRFARDRTYKELFVFEVRSEKDREDRLKKMIERTQASLPGYSCRYFSHSEIPRCQFAIIDNVEVILHSFHGEQDFRCAFRHPELAQFFKVYYNELWSEAGKLGKLKDGNEIHQKEIRSLRENLATSIDRTTSN